MSLSSSERVPLRGLWFGCRYEVRIPSDQVQEREQLAHGQNHCPLAGMPLRSLLAVVCSEFRVSHDGRDGAAELKCAPNTVRALFHKYIGIPPQSFMLKCRIRKAQDLLRMGRSVMEVADLLGFSSSQNFAIRLRQDTGMSPTDWKKS